MSEKVAQSMSGRILGVGSEDLFYPPSHIGNGFVVKVNNNIHILNIEC